MSSRLYNPPSGSAKYWTGMDQAIKNKDGGTQVILDFYVLHFSLVTIVRGHRETLIHRQTLTHVLPPPSICLRSILHSLSNADSINTMIDVQGYEVEAASFMWRSTSALTSITAMCFGPLAAIINMEERCER